MMVPFSWISSPCSWKVFWENLDLLSVNFRRSKYSYEVSSVVWKEKKFVVQCGFSFTEHSLITEQQVETNSKSYQRHPPVSRTLGHKPSNNAESWLLHIASNWVWTGNSGFPSASS